jgi:hypothetical protein
MEICQIKAEKENLENLTEKRNNIVSIKEENEELEKNLDNLKYEYDHIGTIYNEENNIEDIIKDKENNLKDLIEKNKLISDMVKC